MERAALVEKARMAKRESKYVDFKESFDPDATGDWVELVKDIVAMANSGGGVIVVGAKNDGTPSKYDIIPFLDIDPAHFTDKIAKYTGDQFAGLEIEMVERHGQEAAALVVDEVSIPLVFQRTGGYESAPKKQKIAFRKGTVYFRHGAKSEPGNSSDLRQVVEKELDKKRKSWLGNVKKVMQAPADSRVTVITPEELASASLPEVRLTDDPNAPALRGADPNVTHPHRLKEVVKRLNERLAGRKRVNRYDVLCVRETDKEAKNRRYYYKPRWSSPRYSDAFIDWMIGRFEREPAFFEKARMEARKGD